jgi:hypothetical protein
MNPLVPSAVEAGSRAVKFRHARDVEHVLQPQQFLDPAPHGIAAALRAEDHLAQPDFLP